MPINYRDFDLLIERAGDAYKARVVDSPAGEAVATLKLPFSESDVEQFFVQIGHSRLIESSQTQKMREFGQQLFEATFTGDVRDRLRESLNEVSRKGEGLRIRLRTGNVPELTNLPWEFMYDASMGRFLALSIETPLVRYLDIPRDIQPLAIRPPLRILAMISSPRDFPTLNVQKEWDNLQESLSRLESRGMVALTRLEKPTLQMLQRQLRREHYHIFHFIGHGVFSKQYQDGFLLFEDDLREGHRVSSRDLGILLHDHPYLRLAVLNACEGARISLEDQFSGTAQNLMQQGLPAVIAMQFRITDIAAITLAREFYAALADGYPVDAALTEARKAIKTHGNDLEWGTPVLYMRAPNGQIFDVESIQSVPQSTKTETVPDTATETKLTTLYTEGLEAFYLQEWENAVTKFKSILSITSAYRDTASKLEVAQHRLKVSTLDEQAQSAEAKGDWEIAIKALETLAKEFPEQPAFVSRLESARKQQRLKNLYTEVQQLAKAQKWLAVVQAFHEIHSMDANYPDPDDLLSVAEEASAALKMQSELESLYQNALQAIDTSEWSKAQTILNQIQSKQTGYRETGRLLQRANEEIERIERQRQEEDKVSSLYIQAENLLHRKQWQKSLEKVEEIFKLFPGFDDPKQVASQARTELEKTKEESEKQDHLAELYAEAVKANQAGEYQKALEKWKQIRALDENYPDRQRVLVNAQRMIKGLAQPEDRSQWLARKLKLYPGWTILAVGLIWFIISFGIISLAEPWYENGTMGLVAYESIQWSLFGILIGLINALIYRYLDPGMSLNKYLMLIGGWTISSLAVPISLAIFPDVNYNFGIGYTITGVFYGLVLYLTLPEQFRPKLFALILSFAFGMFVGECAWNWFRFSVEFSSQLTGAFSLFTAALISGYLAFGNKIAENSKDTQPGIAKIALSIAGILILARWLSSVIGDYIDGMFLYPVDINWENSTYLMLNLHYVLFAAFTVWFLVRAMKSLLAINMSKRNTTIMIITWIAGMVATSFACVYLEIEQGYDWGWSIGWLLGGIVIGLGMWLATKNSVSQSKFTYLVTSILVWGGGFFLCEKVSWQLQELFIQIFGEPLGRNIAINANVGIAGLVGGLVMFYHFETGRNIHINWKTVLATTLGFALGNALQGLIFYGKDDPVSNTIAAILWGTVSGAFLAVPSRNIKRFILLGFLGGAGIGLGYWIFTRAQTSFPILLGGFFGFSVGLATKNIQKALLLIFLSMIAFELRTEINSFIRESFDLSYNMRMTFNALTSLIIGLIIGLVWSSLKHQKSEETLE